MPTNNNINPTIDTAKKFFLDVLKWVITAILGASLGFVIKTQIDIVNLKRDIGEIKKYELTRIEGKVDVMQKTLDKILEKK